jgi:hypothetical protein
MLHSFAKMGNHLHNSVISIHVEQTYSLFELVSVSCSWRASHWPKSDGSVFPHQTC